MSILSDRQIRELAHKGMITPYHDGGKEPGKISAGLSSFGYDVRCGYRFKVFSPIHATEIDPKNFDPKMLEEVDVTPKHDFVETRITYSQCAYCGIIESKVPTPDPGCPKSPKPNFIRIPPHSFALAESLETFNIPRDILVVVLGKSTYARCGLIVNVTPGEPEWEGKWTIELSNTTPLPIRVYAGEGVMQCLFLRSDEKSEVCGQYLAQLIMDSGPGRLASFRMDWERATCGTSYADKKGKYQGQVGLTLPKVEGK